MPIYEYFCQQCRRVHEVVTTRASAAADVPCPDCGHGGMRRLMSRSRVVLSEQTRTERLEDPAQWAGLDEEDPVALARTLKRMGAAFGDSFEPREVDQALEESMDAAASAPEPDEGEPE
ncbi:FmdB family zinc ribbon protein [Desulfohalobium retbaense]|uniref:Regulatory protein, FmdB family n=1 Tax=Desulfohalobium retbaense (strain ATCC 49708 / DSM 5692 / JCM 16813 / HR100) TaxID=485915 RepID=C8X568_DESRD|nr:zinc ribbon domain-containing protein [Desulfohalobium retbaense]ACV69565.1 regulatory protein, FmdB family [Desulfohalobium retbaense DSM 5692]